MANSPTYADYGIRPLKGVVFTLEKPKQANATIIPNQLLAIDSNGKVGPAGAGSLLVVGCSGDEVGYASGEYLDVLWGLCRVTAGSGGILGGYSLKAGAAGTVIPLIDSQLAGDVVFTSAAGLAFGNQPNDDAVSVVSNDADDDTDVTIIGTTVSTDTVVVETVTLDGTTPVVTDKTNWGIILAVKKAVTGGTITVAEASGSATITTLAGAATSKGVEAVDVYFYNVAPGLVCSDTGTKQIGLQGTNSAGATIYDSQALNGATAVVMNSAFNEVTEIYTGDLEATRTASLMLGAEEDDDLKVGVALEAQDTETNKFWARINRL